MSVRVPRAPVFAAACLLLLGACAGKFGGQPNEPPLAATETTGSLPASAADSKATHANADDVQLGKAYLRNKQYDLAEKSFRSATEKQPRNAAAWIGLATSYDHQRRFDLADRAYQQAIDVAGETAEILNGQGYSYMLRGDYARAKKKLEAAELKDPANPYVQDNIRVLAQHYFDGSQSAQ
jgi:Flp pilus assembly protein TadD